MPGRKSRTCSARVQPEIIFNVLKGGNGGKMVDEKKIYLRIKMDGQETYLKAFPNDWKEKESDPDYKGDGVLVWLNDMKPKQAEQSKPVAEVAKPYQPRRF